MKYKIGDRVEMNLSGIFNEEALDIVESLPYRQATIKQIYKINRGNWLYKMKEEGVNLYWWNESQINCLIKRFERIFEPIESRFDILDIR